MHRTPPKIPGISPHNRMTFRWRGEKGWTGFFLWESCLWSEITALSWENPRLGGQVRAWPRTGRAWGRGCGEGAQQGANAPMPGHSWAPPWLTRPRAWTCIQLSAHNNTYSPAWARASKSPCTAACIQKHMILLNTGLCAQQQSSYNVTGGIKLQ